MMLHRKCPAAWYFRYGLGLGKPVSGPAPYLHYGSWFGAMRTAEALVRGRATGTLIQKPRKFTPVDGGPEFDMKTVTPKDVLIAAVEWWKVVSQDPLAVEEWVKTLGEDLPNRLKGGFLRWRDEYGEASKSEEVLAVEMFWKRTLPRPAADQSWDTGAGDLPEIVLIGFIDELYRDTQRNGMVVVRDNKTTSRMPTMSSLDDMLDSQLQLYAWGITPALHSMEILPPRAISYDRASSVKPTSPKLNQNGTLSASNKLFDLRTYREWVAAGQDYPGRAKDGSGAGTYVEEPEVVAKLSTPTWRAQWHQRTLTPINRQVIQAHLRAAVDTTTDIWRTMQRTSVTFEPPRNISKGNCQWCDYVGLCRDAMFSGADGVFDLREHGLVHKSGLPILERGELRERE
jgi:hypothetical protein